MKALVAIGLLSYQSLRGPHAMNYEERKIQNSTLETQTAPGDYLTILILNKKLALYLIIL